VPREKVSRGLLGALRKSPPDSVWIEQVNGQPAIIASRGGQPYGVLLLEVQAGQVQVLYLIANPDKLRRIVDRLLAGTLRE
jgi:hypothetical protein